MNSSRFKQKIIRLKEISIALIILAIGFYVDPAGVIGGAVGFAFFVLFVIFAAKSKN